MKEKLRELFYSFLALFLFSCAIAAAVFFSMLLIPLLIVTIFVIAVKEIISWHRNNKQPKPGSRVVVEQHKTAVLKSMSTNKPFKKVA